MKKDDIKIDIVENDSNEEVVPIMVSPDFDVNTLAWDVNTIFNFWNIIYDITNIIYNIKAKQTVKLYPTNNRLEKMIKKGWIIMNKDDC